MNTPKRTLLRHTALALSSHGYSQLTIDNYILRLRQLILFYDKQLHPRDMQLADIEHYIFSQIENDTWSAAKQRQFASAIKFLYEHVLHSTSFDLKHIAIPKNKKSLPIYYTTAQIQSVFEYLQEPYWLIAGLGFGCGLRISEVLALRIMDIDFANQVVRVIAGKGNKDRQVPLPEALEAIIKNQIAWVTQLYNNDYNSGPALPNLCGKISQYTLVKQYPLSHQKLFLKSNLRVDHQQQQLIRKTASRQGVDKALKRAMQMAEVTSSGFHSLRHSYATECIRMGLNIRSLQTFLGHESISTTQLYTHVNSTRLTSMRSPLDFDHLDDED